MTLCTALEILQALIPIHHSETVVTAAKAVVLHELWNLAQTV